MRVEVPEICYHATEDIMPMLSLDVHAMPAVGLAPPITRLATAGGDHTVRVWALTDAPDSTAAAAATAGAAVPAAVATNGGAVPAAAVGRSRTQLTFLAELKHDKSINAVKFSPDGKRIATGGDDGLVLIWRRIEKPAAAAAAAAATAATAIPAVAAASSPQEASSSTAPAASPANGEHASAIDLTSEATPAEAVAAAAAAAPATPATPNPFALDADDAAPEQAETWQVESRLRGHGSEVYDLCWSPSGEELLSGSIDHTCLIWSLPFGAPAKSSQAALKDHLGYVQGVAWDPLNLYIATQSSDRTVRVYERQGRAAGAAGKAAKGKAAVARALEFGNMHILRNRKAPRLPGSKTETDAENDADEDDAMDEAEEGSAEVAAATAGDASTAAATDLTGESLPLSPSAKALGLVPAQGRESKAGIAMEKEKCFITRALFTDDNLSYFRRLSFSPDGAFLVAPAGSYHADEVGRGLTAAGVVAAGPAASLAPDLLGLGEEDDPTRPEMNLLARFKIEAGRADAAAALAAEKEADKAGGNLLASASARAALPTVYLFHRSDGFKTPVAHLPQLEPAVAVKFCPRLFERRAAATEVANAASAAPGAGAEGDSAAAASAAAPVAMEDGAAPAAATTVATPAAAAASPSAPSSSSVPSYRMVFAVATSKCVLFYDTESLYPLCVVKNIHHSGLTDLCWTPCGTTLVTSSSDGYCAYIRFDPDAQDGGSGESELGRMLPDALMERYRKWWELRRLGIEAALVQERGPRKSGASSKASAEPEDDKAKVDIKALLGAEPAPLPTWCPPSVGADGLASPSTAAAARPATHVHVHVHAPRPDSELMQHAMEVLQSGQRLNASRIQNDCSTGPKRAKKTIADVEALQQRALHTVFAPVVLQQLDITAASSTAGKVGEDFEAGLARALGVGLGSNLREAPRQKPPPPFVFSIVPRPVAPVLSPAEAAAAAAAAAAATAATPTPAAIAAASADPIVINDSPPAPKVEEAVKAETVPAAGVAAAAEAAVAPGVPPAASAAVPQSPAKAEAAASASPHVTPSTKGKLAPSSSSSTGPSGGGGAPTTLSKKRKSAGGSAVDAKPKTTIMDMFRKVANKAPATPSATAAPSAPSASASASKGAPVSGSGSGAARGTTAAASSSAPVVDLSLDDVPTAAPRAKRRITPTQPDAAATAAPAPASTATPAPAPAAPSSAPIDISSDTEAVVESKEGEAEEDDDDDVSEEYVVEKLVKKRTTPSGGVEYFVKWQGFAASANTWEPVEHLRDCAEALAAFEKSQKRRRVIPTLVSDVPMTTAAPAAPAASVAGVTSPSTAAPSSTPTRSSVPVAVSSSIAALSASPAGPRSSPRKRKADEDAETAAVGAAAPATATVPAAPATEAAKKVKRKITPQAL